MNKEDTTQNNKLDPEIEAILKAELTPEERAKRDQRLKEWNARKTRDKEFIKKIPELAVTLNNKYLSVTEKEIQKHLHIAEHGPERYFYEYLYAVVEGFKGSELRAISRLLGIKEDIVNEYTFNEAIYNNITFVQDFLTLEEIQRPMLNE